MLCAVVCICEIYQTKFSTFLNVHFYTKFASQVNVSGFNDN